MSSEQSPTAVPPMDSFARKAALRKMGVYQTHIAKALEVDQGMVSHVLNGTKGWQGAKGRQIMVYISDLLQLPLGVVFPHAERRKSRPFDQAAA
jgi:hypothetical protein